MSAELPNTLHPMLPELPTAELMDGIRRGSVLVTGVEVRLPRGALKARRGELASIQRRAILALCVAALSIPLVTGPIIGSAIASLCAASVLQRMRWHLQAERRLRRARTHRRHQQLITSAVHALSSLEPDAQHIKDNATRQHLCVAQAAPHRWRVWLRTSDLRQTSAFTRAMVESLSASGFDCQRREGVDPARPSARCVMFWSEDHPRSPVPT